KAKPTAPAAYGLAFDYGAASAKRQPRGRFSFSFPVSSTLMRSSSTHSEDAPVELLELKWPDVAALSKDVPIVIPIAALEQHGRHMPVFTDSLLLGEVVRRIKEPLKERVLLTPLFWLGNSHHHIDFP